MTSAATDSSLHVSFEDQQKINKFARHNSKFDDLTDELKAKENDLQALEDAESDLLLAEGDKIPFKIGDVFVYVTSDEAQQMIEERKESVMQEKKELLDQQQNLKEIMSDLKVQLYAKFGNNINLEPE